MESIENNYYNLLEIKFNANSKEIINAYKNKISKFKNINNFSYEQINEIKLLKKGLYILLNKKLRLKYNIITGILRDNYPVAVNQENEMSLDSIFNIDNSWMSKHSNNKYNKKTDLDEINLIGDRIFSLSNLNKKQGYSTDHEINLRKPLQCRLDKDL
jgi:hypothetical protein